jgi:hypothetical protein
MYSEVEVESLTFIIYQYMAKGEASINKNNSTQTPYGTNS